MHAEVGKEKVKLPLTAYDLFGYLIPGTVAFIAIYLFEFLISTRLKGDYNMPLFLIFNAVSKSNALKDSWALSAAFLVCLVIIIYVFGHIISSLSSFFIDRVLVNKGHGYPYLTLFGFENRDLIGHWETGAFYKGLIFWANIFLILWYFTNVTANMTLYWIMFFMICFIGFFIALKIIAELICHFDKDGKAKFFLVIPKRLKAFSLSTAKFLVNYLFAGPYDCCAKTLSHYVNTYEPFNEELRSAYKKYFHAKFGLNAETADSNNYWFCTCYIAECSPSLNSMIINWFHMYSYSRNIAAAFYVAFIYCFISILSQETLRESLKNDFFILLLPIFCFALFTLMLFRYYYLYYSYYSKFLFRTFIYLNKTEKKQKRTQKKAHSS